MIKILIPNQMINVRWNNTNQEWYESLGYKYTNKNAWFSVKAEDLSRGSKANIKANCDYCNEDYTTCAISYFKGRKSIPKDCCSRCTGKKTSEVSYIKRRDKVFKQLNELCDTYGYELLTEPEEFIDQHQPFSFKCFKHGIQTQIIGNFLTGKHKCYFCGREQVGQKLKKDIETLIIDIESKNNNKLLNPNEYIDTNTSNLKILCSCGNEFITSYICYMNYNIDRCRKCSQTLSQGELRVKNILDKYNITYEMQKRFDDCRNKKPLPFDFYIPIQNQIIEFDGEQHYTEVYNKHPLEYVKKHDEIKNNYCKNNNIKLLRIPYWDINNIETILTNAQII